MRTPISHIISVSGGKDSLATALLAIERLFTPDGKPVRPEDEVVFVFADTGNEASETYEFLDYLDKEFKVRCGIGITRVKIDWLTEERFAQRREAIKRDWAKEGISQEKIDEAVANMYPTGNQFLDLAKLKGTLPSRHIKFCTIELKLKPIAKQIVDPRLEAGKTIIQWIGMRRDDGKDRKNTPHYEKNRNREYYYYPLRHWTKDDAFAFALKNGINKNVLYDWDGVERVGCWPCMQCCHAEILTIAEHYPDTVQKIMEWEAEVAKTNKKGIGMFFTPKTQAQIDHVKKTKESIRFEDIIRHCQGYDILRDIPYEKTLFDLIKAKDDEESENSGCVSGLCE